MREIFFFKRVIKHWNKMLREVIKSPCLEVFKKHVDIALDNMV